MACPQRHDGGYAWAKGDVAECIGTGVWQPSGDDGAPERRGPMRNETRIVVDVRQIDLTCGCQAIFLQFARWPDDWFLARWFRRITPRAEAIYSASPTFVAQLAPKAAGQAEGSL